jgi:hypothetical protein
MAEPTAGHMIQRRIDVIDNTIRLSSRHFFRSVPSAGAFVGSTGIAKRERMAQNVIDTNMAITSLKLNQDRAWG